MIDRLEGKREYDNKDLLRLKLSVYLLLAGWVASIIAMFVPACWDFIPSRGPEAVTSLNSLMYALFYAVFCLPATLTNRGGREISPEGLPIYAFCAGYFVAMIGVPFAVLRRPRPIALWSMRVMSVGLLMPWYNVILDYTDKPPPPGPGDLIWAFGGLFIAVSAWLTFPRTEGESRSTMKVLIRAMHGQHTIREADLPTNGFPVIPRGDMKNPDRSPQ